MTVAHAQNAQALQLQLHIAVRFCVFAAGMVAVTVQVKLGLRERTLCDFRHTFGHVNTRQCGQTAECALCQFGDAAANSHLGDLIGISSPRSAVGAVILQCAAAGDPQRVSTVAVVSQSIICVFTAAAAQIQLCHQLSELRGISRFCSGDFVRVQLVLNDLLQRTQFLLGSLDRINFTGCLALTQLPQFLILCNEVLCLHIREVDILRNFVRRIRTMSRTSVHAGGCIQFNRYTISIYIIGSIIIDGILVHISCGVFKFIQCAALDICHHELACMGNGLIKRTAGNVILTGIPPRQLLISKGIGVKRRLILIGHNVICHFAVTAAIRIEPQGICLSTVIGAQFIVDARCHGANASDDFGAVHFAHAMYLSICIQTSHIGLLRTGDQIPLQLCALGRRPCCHRAHNRFHRSLFRRFSRGEERCVRRLKVRHRLEGERYLGAVFFILIGNARSRHIRSGGVHLHGVSFNIIIIMDSGIHYFHIGVQEFKPCAIIEVRRRQITRPGNGLVINYLDDLGSILIPRCTAVMQFASVRIVDDQVCHLAVAAFIGIEPQYKGLIAIVGGQLIMGCSAAGAVTACKNLIGIDCSVIRKLHQLRIIGNFCLTDGIRLQLLLCSIGERLVGIPRFLRLCLFSIGTIKYVGIGFLIGFNVSELIAQRSGICNRAFDQFCL